jgi:hypothetical protein
MLVEPPLPLPTTLPAVPVLLPTPVAIVLPVPVFAPVPDPELAPDPAGDTLLVPIEPSQPASSATPTMIVLVQVFMTLTSSLVLGVKN